MSHRDEVLFFQDIKFRNKLVEYLSDWVAREENNDFTHEILVNSRYNKTGPCKTTESLCEIEIYFLIKTSWYLFNYSLFRFQIYVEVNALKTEHVWFINWE